MHELCAWKTGLFNVTGSSGAVDKCLPFLSHVQWIETVANTLPSFVQSPKYEDTCKNIYFLIESPEDKDTCKNMSFLIKSPEDKDTCKNISFVHKV